MNESKQKTRHCEGERVSQASGAGLRDSRGGPRKGHCHNQESSLVTEVAKQRSRGPEGVCQLPTKVRKGSEQLETQDLS